MDVDSWTKWVTLCGAVVAAVTGLLSLRGRADRFSVGVGSLRPEILREKMMHVVSRSDHVVHIVDYGFIDENNRLSSIRLELDDFEFYDTITLGSGSPILEGYSSSFEIGYVRRDHPIGAYARSATQSRPTLAFGNSTPYWRRIWVRTRIWWKGAAYLC